MQKASQAALILIGAVALVFALDIAESILAPLALALVIGVVLSPLSDFWDRKGVAPGFAAMISLLLTLALLMSVTLMVQPLLARLMAQAPKVWVDLQETVSILRGMVRGFSKVSGEVAEAISPGADAGTVKPASEGLAMPGITDALLLAPSIAAQFLIFVGALFFFLLTRTQIYEWFARSLAAPTERTIIARRMREAERRVSRYFITIFLINTALGIVTAMVMAALGMPGAALWGAVAFVMNFVMYVGPALVAGALLFAGVAVFDGPMVVAPALAFVALNSLEGQFITPAFVGRTLSVNPLLVFLALIFGLWLWGPIGGIVAMPLLVWVLVLTDVISAPLPSNGG
ncbi:AI-2E family transporter [Phaeovulum sp.]|uniref:AI-2E family transporter n=1 Tax=Phaeovulum sp. TaxID=2934796 RepID=UPI0039E32859